MWFIYLVLGCISAWIVLSPALWKWIWHLVKPLFVGEIPEKRGYQLKIEPTKEIKPTPKVSKLPDDLSKLSKEEITEVLKNSDVRVKQ